MADSPASNDVTAQRKADNLAFCRDEVRKGAEDHWLAAQFAPAAARDSLVALYAFALEIHRIPASVSEPPLGAIRQQWWREALDEVFGGGPVRAHPVVEALAAVLDRQDAATLRPLMDEAIDAMGWYLDPGHFADGEDALSRLESSHGTVACLAVRLLGATPGEADAATIRRAEAIAAAARLLGPQGAGDVSRTQGGPIGTPAERLHALAGDPGADSADDTAAADPSGDFAATLADAYRLLGDRTKSLPAQAMPAIAQAALVPGHLAAARRLRRDGSVSLSPLRDVKRRFAVTRAILTGRV